ncbi:peptidylprolyl isomerase [Bremerella sp. JC817]|uniref:peptidylprolyl isomerase n=1 Tax=Bremerella sp. JC817 TaxID=3231756 RepID=UPI0034573F73
MTDALLPVATATMIVLGLLLFAVALSRFVAKRLALRPALARRKRADRKYYGQQLEARQMLDAAAASEAATLEGESITVGNVTYENVDMIALAKAIAETGTLFFGASWCPKCANQKEMFGDGAAYLPYVEASTPAHGQSTAGIIYNITAYPTWIFPDGTRLIDTQDLDVIIERSGVTIPQAEPLYFAEIPDQLNLKAGQSYHIALDGYSPQGYDLTYTVSTSSGDIQAQVLTGNRSMRITTNRFGPMEFYLFEDEANLATSRVIQLAESGFYDGTIFHRIIDGFVIQGGDAGSNPDGSGGSDLPEFDDVFDPDLRHNTTGMLSFAKPNYDDSNNSQFFITEGDQSHLDFNHSVFGFLTEGEAARQAISGTPSTSANGYRPTYDVALEKVEIFTDTENGVLRLKIPEALASGTVTVTVSDGHGYTLTRTFQVSAVTDTQNYNAFLDVIPDVTLNPGGSYTYQMTANSVDGDPVTFYTASTPPTGLTFSVNPTTGVLQINTSVSLAPGTYSIYVAVSDEVESPTTSILDYQQIMVYVGNNPVLNNDTINATEDQPITFNPLSNDTGGTGTLVPSSVQVLSQPANGELTIDRETGDFTFTPAKDFNGTVTFQYRVMNTLGLYGSPATVSLIVAPVNDEGKAYADFFYADPLGATLLPVLKNDDRGAVNEQNDALIISLPSLSTNAGGTVSVSGDQVQYIPANGFTGTDTFTYTIHDGEFTSTATVTVDVREVSNFSISAVTSPTETEVDGFVDSLPQSDAVIGEWDSFWLEVWVTPDGTGGNGITAASAQLNFDPTVYRASTLIIGEGFQNSGATTLSNNLGYVRLDATSSIDDFGVGGRVLLGRIKFVPVANGIDVASVGESLGVGFDHFLTSMTNVSLTVDGVGSVATPSFDTDVATKLVPMIYDLDDDGKVGLTDFSTYWQSYGNENASAFVDFDLSATASSDDYTLFLQAMGSRFDSLNNTFQMVSAVFDAVSSNLILAPIQAAVPVTQSLTQSVVEQVTGNLPNSVVSPSLTSDAQVVTIQIVDLDGSQLAKTVGNTIYLDHNAAGWGWFVDPTPQDSSEFQYDSESNRLIASAAASKIDLVSVLMHELGHIAGLAHSDEGLMSSVILPGERLLDLQSDPLDETFYIAAVDQFFSEDD